MKSIGEFFARIQNSQTKEVILRTVISEAIKKVTTIEIPMEKVSFKGMKVILKGISQTERTEIFLKKNSIIKEIEKQGIKRKITDFI